jgi:hypothetical protein
MFTALSLGVIDITHYEWYIGEAILSLRFITYITVFETSHVLLCRVLNKNNCSD